MWRKLLSAAALGGFVLAAAGCYEPAYYHRYGYGGAGGRYVDLRAAQDQCVNAAQAQNFRVLDVRRVEQTSPVTAHVRLGVSGFLGERGVTCDYDARTNAAIVR